MERGPTWAHPVLSPMPRPRASAMGMTKLQEGKGDWMGDTGWLVLRSPNTKHILVNVLFF